MRESDRRDTDRDKESSHLLVHSPNVWNSMGQGWTKVRCQVLTSSQLKQDLNPNTEHGMWVSPEVNELLHQISPWILGTSEEFTELVLRNIYIFAFFDKNTTYVMHFSLCITLRARN